MRGPTPLGYRRNDPPEFRLIYAIAALFVLQLLGDVLVRWLGLPIPGPLVGMLLMFGGLIVLGRVPPALESVSGALLRHLMLLFIPAVAGLMLHFARVADEWIPFLLAGIGGAAVTIVVSALTLRWTLRLAGEPEQ